MENKTIIKMKSTKTVTHSKRIPIGELIQVFKAYCGAPEDATVIWPTKPPPYDAREVEIIWSEKEVVEETNAGTGNTPVPSTHPWREDVLSVGDIVMVRNLGESTWTGWPEKLINVINDGTFLTTTKGKRPLEKWDRVRKATAQEIELFHKQNI